MAKRVFDILFSVSGILLLFPLLVIISILVKITSKGPILFTQQRVGLNNVDFKIYKFRTMYNNTGSLGNNLTIGNGDKRITNIGYYLRKHKLDELPQLFNVLKGDMSVVGPRPELRYFIEKFPKEYPSILLVRPGITCTASVAFVNENELLTTKNNPEKFYLQSILPYKIKLNKVYVENQSFLKDISIIIKTIMVVLFKVQFVKPSFT